MISTQAPDNCYGNDADREEDNVHAKQQTVNDYPDHIPVLRGFALVEVFVHLEANGLEISAQLP